MSIVSNMLIGAEQYLIKDYYSGFGALNYPIQTNQTNVLTPISSITSSYNNSNLLTIQNGLVINKKCLIQLSLFAKATFNVAGNGVLAILKNNAALKSFHVVETAAATRYASLTIITQLNQNDKLTVGYILNSAGGQWSEIQLSALTLAPDLNPVPAMLPLSEDNELVYVLNYNGDAELI